MSAHTPAPWMVDGTTAAENLDVIGEGGRVAMLDCDDIDADTLEANARLIAAAPDMLAALQMVEAIWSRDQTANIDPESPLAKVRAAIKKATGENT
jgi:hypothetical protein